MTIGFKGNIKWGVSLWHFYACAIIAFIHLSSMLLTSVLPPQVLLVTFLAFSRPHFCFHVILMLTFLRKDLKLWKPLLPCPHALLWTRKDEWICNNIADEMYMFSHEDYSCQTIPSYSNVIPILYRKISHTQMPKARWPDNNKVRTFSYYLKME